MVCGQSWDGGSGGLGSLGWWVRWVGFAEQTWRASAGVGFGVVYRTVSPGHQEWPEVSRSSSVKAQCTVLVFNLKLQGFKRAPPAKHALRLEHDGSNASRA